MESDVLPDVLSMPVSLTSIDHGDLEGFVAWLVEDFDVDPQAARQVLPSPLLGLLVATAEGWVGRVWSGAPLEQKQQMLNQFCLHEALGDLRAEPGDWWWFPLSAPTQGLVSPSDSSGSHSPEERVQERLTDQLLAAEDPDTVLAGADLRSLERLAQRYRLPLTTVLLWAARHGAQPVWLRTSTEPEAWWGNTAALATGLIPTEIPHVEPYHYLEVHGTAMLLSRPMPRLRQNPSTDLTELLPLAAMMDWITAADFNYCILQNLLPHLERVHARVVLCLEQPDELEGFFLELGRILSDPPPSVREALYQARTTGHLQLRLGVGLSPKYQIALLEDAYSDAIYYYAALNQPVRVLTSWEGKVDQYRQRFENLWQTAADQRIQLIDLSDLLEQYGC
ncbi:hypothetical protein [Anthocerotibacter panamensis]|uniref:hypothetical protein n=1 Tax=Anthocerotibacter panamensis TaxID=2857077 RepID=UPI001C407EC6|nr:hypothetical protein [Anthocerotibacter panamensis]